MNLSFLDIDKIEWIYKNKKKLKQNHMKTKIDKWQIIKDEISGEWQSLLIRKRIKIFWAYTKLFWALCFCKNEFSKLIELDTEAIFCMSKNEEIKYSNIVSKVRSHIYGFANYKRKMFVKNICKMS